MKALFQTILGLLIDDWWMGIGIIMSILITAGLIRMELSDAITGWLLTLFLILTLFLSLSVEYRKKKQTS
ncbi:hypothetical protein [Paenibacillus sp. RC67]|uniref:hypothetical protein n=1 Tax=Paenibacillus sp. RC67 TaxID=3039392 RepID=UPI0024AE64B6|nr:hypothetical protein [Paenibacillus sp. RC67]